MVAKSRIATYLAIEAHRQRPLLVYATSTRGNVPAMIAGDTVREFIDQIDQVAESVAEIDVLIHSAGGDPLAAWKLMSILRERFARVHVLVPFMAFSAATIFALGADEIVMHPHASLGPIDPQIRVKLPDGKERHFAFEDVGAFLRFLRDQVGIADQACLTTSLENLFAVVDPVNIGAAKRASELATDVAERLLRIHMTASEDEGRARSIAEALNKSFFAHGDAVSRTRARELNLRIAENDAVLEALMWKAYLGLEAFLDLRSPFNPLEHYLANGGSAAVSAPGPLVVPSNTPPEIVQQLWNQVARQALQRLSEPVLQVPFEFLSAVVESSRWLAAFRSEGVLSGTRLLSGQIHLVANDTSSGWQRSVAPSD